MVRQDSILLVISDSYYIYIYTVQYICHIVLLFSHMTCIKTGLSLQVVGDAYVCHYMLLILICEH